MEMVRITEVEQAVEEKRVAYSHTARAYGYISRKTEGYAERYDGKFGKGYKVHKPAYDSTRYHYVEYYIEKGGC